MLPLVTKPLVMMDVIYSRYNKENNTFFNSLRKNDVEAQVEITLKVMDRARVNCYWRIIFEKQFVSNMYSNFSEFWQVGVEV